jgi:hypothetical protein
MMKYHTIIEYAKKRGYNMDVKTACNHGRIVSQICRTEQITPVPIKDALYGKVNSYPESILDFYFNDESKLARKFVVMPFGMHRGRDIEDIDPDYLAWVVENVNGYPDLIADIKQHLATPEVAAEVVARAAAKEQKKMRAEAKAHAITKATLFVSFDDAERAGMRTKSAWSQSGYKLLPDQHPSGLVAVYGHHQKYEVYREDQVTPTEKMKKELEKEEQERMEALKILEAASGGSK